MCRTICSLGLIAVVALSCKKGTPPAPPRTAEATVPTIEVQKDSPLLFTYVNPKGVFATTDKAGDVPENARRLVRVVDPSKGGGTDATRVYAIDLGELLRAGKTTSRALSREAFETGALAQLPPGESSPLSGPHGPALPELPSGVDAGVGPLGPPVVILYGTRATSQSGQDGHPDRSGADPRRARPPATGLRPQSSGRHVGRLHVEAVRD